MSIVRDGRFWRKSDGRWIKKFHCRNCGQHFSNAIFSPAYRQNKRHKNESVRQLLVERCSIRGIARLEKLSRTTVARKLKFLGGRAKVELDLLNGLLKPVEQIQFDDMETAIHSKYKPVALSIAIVAGTRWILGFAVSEMPVKWKLTGKKKSLYGRRPDNRRAGRVILFTKIRPFVMPNVEISSDMHPHYPKCIREHFPLGSHVRYRSRKPSDHGQDELKCGPDPLFSFNHTAAMHRDRMARLARKSWCLSKSKAALEDHLAIYAVHHNKQLKVFRSLAA